MSSPHYPDDPNTPPQPAPSPTEPPNDLSAPPTLPPGTYPPASAYPPPSTYPPAPGPYTPPAAPSYGPPSTPLPPGAYPPPPDYSAPPSVPLPGYGAPPTTPLHPGYAPPAPMIEPTPTIRQSFQIAGIGGAGAFVAYVVFGLPWFWPLWLVPALAAFVGLLGFVPSVRNRAYGRMTPHNGALAAMLASGLGLLFLFFVWGGLHSLGFWIVALGFVAGIIGGARVFRETPPASATASIAASPTTPLYSATGVPSVPSAATTDPTGPSGAAPMPTSPASPPAIQKATAAAATPRKQENLILLIIAIIADLITGAWSLVIQIAVVILVIVGVVGFIKGCAASATLNEHSSCQDFQQASSDAQNKVLQDMMTAHHDTSGNITLARASLTLYCNIYGSSAPIDGIYGSGAQSQPPARVLHVSASPIALAQRGQARPTA